MKMPTHTAMIPLLAALCASLCVESASNAAETFSRELSLTNRYLNFPVKTGAPKNQVALMLDGQTAREFEIELAPAEPDFWVFLDVSPFLGRTATLAGPVGAKPGIEAAECSSRIRGAENLYGERLRPQYHFSSRRGWNNDPNGMVFFNGEYHLYYQHNPYGWAWGNMHWGHAVSRDLVHWTELPIALYPNKFGDWAFSGSAVVDWKNTGGFQKGKEPALVLAYTSTGRGECIACSHDRGRTWTEYEGNPVVKHQGRDPRLLWHEPSHQWVMAVYDEADKRWIAFYTSSDLKSWSYQSRIEGFYECPDMVELAVDGNPKARKWVLSGASSEYRIGSFDGRTFHPETPMLPGHKGNAFYAAQTFSDIPSRDGRCIQVGWGRISTAGMPFNQMMCFPTVMTLKSTAEGPRLAWAPVEEIKKLRARSHRWKNLKVEPGSMAWDKVRGGLLEMRASFEPGQTGKTIFSLCGAEIVYDAQTRELASQGVSRPLKPSAGRMAFTALLDKTSLEIFADDGLLYMPLALKNMPPSGKTGIEAQGGGITIRSLVIHELKSSWPDNKK